MIVNSLIISTAQLPMDTFKFIQVINKSLN